MKRIYTYLLIILLTSSFLNAVFDSHFFHAGYFWNEPRLIEPGMQTLSFDLSGDSTTQSRNSCKDIVPLFDRLGLNNMQTIGLNIDLNPNNPLEKYVIDLLELPSRNGFSNLSFDGFFKMMRFEFKFYQNFNNGFFSGVEFPIFEFESALTKKRDLSPTDNRIPNRSTPEWQDFLKKFDAILNKFDIETEPIRTTNMGDTILIAGYGINYDDQKYLDLIDATFMLCGLIPTGKQSNPDQLLDIPNGYNGHFGIGFSGDGAIGFYDWITLGLHASYLILLPNNKEIRVKSAPQQFGLVKLEKTLAKIDAGNVWRLGTFFKGDHMVEGLSFLFGYSYEQQNKSIIEKCFPSCNLQAANTDRMLDGFTQHNFHLAIEFDISKDDYQIGPRCSFFFNHSITGRRIYDTNIKGGMAGIDVTWCF